jgi:hypothetical protein
MEFKYGFDVLLIEDINNLSDFRLGGKSLKVGNLRLGIN